MALVTQLLLFSGIIIILFSVIYMILHVDSADSIIILWAVSMCIGCSFVFWSWFINYMYKALQKKK